MQCQNCGDVLDKSEMPKMYRSSAFEDEESGEVHVSESIERSGRCTRCGTITMTFESCQEEVDIEANEYL
jgi:ribosomal protein S27E